jgi:hypothetical protein
VASPQVRKEEKRRGKNGTPWTDCPLIIKPLRRSGLKGEEQDLHRWNKHNHQEKKKWQYASRLFIRKGAM